MSPTQSPRAGFSLIETLAALAISSTIILAIGSLVHQSVFFFDHGTRTIDETDALARGIDALAGDFAAARFVAEKTGPRRRAAFAGTPTNVLFIAGGGRAARPPGEEVVSLTIENGDAGATELVRRRSAWPGPRQRIIDASPQDPVVLLKGTLSLSFSFSQRMPDGRLVWGTHWTGETGLPHSVRLNLLDTESGADLTAPPEFPLYADAPANCATGEAKCVSLAAKDAGTANPPAPSGVRE
jgi:prepilin-type N-terminal cleavage/methylation domain-containing protein